MGGHSADTLITSFLSVVRSRPDSPAVHYKDRSITYSQFFALVEAVVGELQVQGVSDPVGLYCGRDLMSYVGIWACVFRGVPFVPLNPKLPDSRLKKIIKYAGITAVISGEDDDFDAERFSFKGNVFSRVSEVGRTAVQDYIEGRVEQDTAYIMFTSGSTGVPKGVPISYMNLVAFCNNITSMLGYSACDRYAQVCETSFDLSMHEIFSAILSGGCLYPARDIDLYNPVHFIKKHEISVWHSVPSVAIVAKESGLLLQDSMPSLRISVFNGEPLTKSIVESWQRAASSTEIWNFYGPTECTVAALCQKVCLEDTSCFDGNNVSIGEAFVGTEIALGVDKDVVGALFFENGMAGELLLAGDQLYGGYITGTGSDPFVVEKDIKYYQTGDRVYWCSGRVFHLGRTDYQVKIGGYRVELLEVEFHLKRALQTELLAVVAWPRQNPNLLVLCVERKISLAELNELTADLPFYMQPKRVMQLSTFPTNQNGKVDRKEIVRAVERVSQ